MSGDAQSLTEIARIRALKACELVDVSVKKLSPYDPEHVTTPEQQEPYDALSDRLMRAVETCLKFFRSYENYTEGENSDTVRDLLNRMEKLRLISDTHRWMEMRDVRNRIVHDYIPEQVKKLYDLMMGEFAVELQNTASRIKQVRQNQNA